MKMIHAHVWNPMERSLFHKPKRTEAAQFHVVLCSASEDCPLFTRGQCIARRIDGFGGNYCRCPFGSASVTQGPTARARGFGDWICEKKAQQTAAGTLAAPPDRVVQIRDQVWLPYAHMAQVLHGESHAFRGPFFLSVVEFTPELVARLAEGRPRTIFGDVIRAYALEEVPKFLGHLADDFPDLLRQAAALSPRITAILPKLTKVGRRALLATVRPNVGTFEGWTWDGEYMISGPGSKLPPFTPFGAQEMRIRPGPKADVRIESDAQVAPETVLLD